MGLKLHQRIRNPEKNLQVLIESGILPGFENNDETLGISLMTNDSMRYECRWVYLKHINACNQEISDSVTIKNVNQNFYNPRYMGCASAL